jgi:voltage-gated potassium channel
MYSFKRIRYLLILPFVIVIIGTIVFMVIEGLSFLDALYFTIVTISTVGYGDIHPATAAGKIFCIFLIIVGIGTFLTLLTTIAQWLIQQRQYGMHKHRLNTLIGVFFTEAGNQLLRTFAKFDPNISSIRQEFLIAAEWSELEFQQLKIRLKEYEHTIAPTGLDLERMHHYLASRGDMLVRQMENADIIENETFAELLWAVIHLRDELAARPSLENLPQTDIIHIANDVKRAYSLLTMQWIDYMQYLKNRYPFLFSFALRTNPFTENPDAVIKG